MQDTKERRFGALGLSRRMELAYRPLTYSSMSEVIKEFINSYEKWWHRVLKVVRFIRVLVSCPRGSTSHTLPSDSHQCDACDRGPPISGSVMRHRNITE